MHPTASNVLLKLERNCCDYQEQDVTHLEGIIDAVEKQMKYVVAVVQEPITTIHSLTAYTFSSE
jgi:hypothetical protein